MIGNDPLDLGGQIAFVTGAGQGVGRGIALALARHNTGGVAVNDFYPERAAAVVAEIEALGVRAVAACADVGDYNAIQSVMANVKDKLGPITLLVNNAGNAGPTSAIGRGAHFWEQPRDDWDRFFRTNLHGVMNCCHAAMPGMVELKKGRIVTIVSDAGRVGGAGLVTYSAAKSGASGFVRALAREAGRFGITCNAISLSSMLPDMSEADRAKANSSEKSKPMLSQYIIRRFGSPDDVSTMAVFLCSDSSAWITGQNYPVNGGFSLSI